MVLRDLAALGVSLSIDDFGTGYSSLSYLKQFPVDELKIDKSFVQGLGEDPNDTAIVAAIVAMAHALDLCVVAEGVETSDQLDRLRTLGCEQAQGYLFARPQPGPDVAGFLVTGAVVWEQQADTTAGAEVARYHADRVLVVDDTPEVRQLARMSLAAVGFEVHEAAEGTAAMSMARQIRPDCIVLDLMMPGLSGLELCRLLRQDPATASCTIVMLTANDDPEDKVEAFSSGADDYIVKPFSPRDLSSRVQSAMRRRAQTPGEDE
jgi:CheY-like chemotaxis protein